MSRRQATDIYCDLCATKASTEYELPNGLLYGWSKATISYEENSAQYNQWGHVREIDICPAHKLTATHNGDVVTLKEATNA